MFLGEPVLQLQGHKPLLFEFLKMNSSNHSLPPYNFKATKPLLFEFL